MSAPSFNRDAHYLGGLCKRGHRWNGADQSLRTRAGGDCVECRKHRDRVLGSCGEPGCGRVRYMRGLCSRHYAEWQLTQPDYPRCSAEGCERPARGRGMCGTHYNGWRRKNNPRKCTVEGCGLPLIARGLCATHYWALRTGRDVSSAKPGVGLGGNPRPKRERYISKGTSKGYVHVLRPDHPRANNHGYVLEHILVMETRLGRPLRDGEVVHHKNGVRHDNLPDNLELWYRGHPSGQRLEDRLRDALRSIEQYRGDAAWSADLEAALREVCHA